MQSLGWYVRRLRGMSAREVLWRTGSELRDVADRLRAGTGRPIGPSASASAKGSAAPGFRVSGIRPGAWANAPRGSLEAGWCSRLRSRADAIAAHRLSFFSLENVDLGHPIDWNREHEAGRPMPMGFAPRIDYRDYRVTGDAKVAWEPSRHHQLVVLARAYRATGDPGYARAAVEQLDSWIARCPFPFGMQWRSPLELAIRLINWVFALDLVHEAGLVQGDLQDRIRHSAHRHLWEVERKFSRGSSANNHLIGEAAGVFVGASYFSDLPGADRWREESRAILLREVAAQTYPEGGNRELALGYHVFALQFFLVAGLAARQSGHDFPAPYWSEVERMCAFLAAMGEGGELPLYGDADDGYVLDLGEPRGDWRGMLAVGAGLFGRPDMKAVAGGWSEAGEWLLGTEGRAKFDTLPTSVVSLESRAFPSSGHYLLQAGAGAGRVSVLFDCGELGFGSIAAHGHADALSFTLRLGGHDVLVDPGTYDYFTHPDWRRYFRSSAGHNTLVVDDRDQSEMQGLFLWGARAIARCLAYEPSARGGRVVGEHDGYARLADPVVHRRTLELDAEAGTLIVRDEIDGAGAHEVAVFFHFSEDCRLSTGKGKDNVSEVLVAGRKVVVETDPRLTLSVLLGSERPIGGWVSRGYHRKAPAPTLVARARLPGPATLVTRIVLGLP
jgi:Heparinase II/III-like protein/Heparinase II/III N-terminus